MGFIYLASGVLFDTTNGEGQLLHAGTGICLALDPLATLFLQAALEAETKACVLATLASRVDATLEQLEESLQSVLDQLFALHFLSTTPSSEVRIEDAERVPPFSAEDMHLSQQPLVSRQDQIDWEFFLTGRVANAPLPHIPLFRRGYAFWKTGSILLLVGYSHFLATLFDLLRQNEQALQIRKHGWVMLSQALSHLKSDQSHLETDLLWRLARRELVFCQMLVRSLSPTGVCLLRSIAFCAYLRALGLPAKVVIGRASFDLSSRTPFHAWTELAGMVVNDHAELQSGYVALQQFPQEASVLQPQEMLQAFSISHP